MILRTLLILGVTAALSVSSNFTDGLELLKKKRYSKAVHAFTKVLDSKESGQTFHSQARWYRALAYIGDKELALAREDLVWLVEHGTEPSLRDEARDLFFKTGGKKETLLPVEGPEEVFAAFSKTLEKGDLASAKNYLVGDLRGWDRILESVSVDGRSRSGLEALAQERESLRFISETISEAGDAATVIVSYNGRFELGMTPRGGRWLFSSIIRYEPPQAVTALREPPGYRRENEGNVRRLQTLGVAIRLYNVKTGRYPGQLEDLRPTIADAAIFMWSGPGGTRKEPFALRTDMPKAVDADSTDSDSSVTPDLLAAAPVATRGRREVLYRNGVTGWMPEKTFLSRVTDQTWVTSLKAADSVEPDLRKSVERLIQALGSPDVRVRADARRGILEAGAEALPILDAHREAPDLEIRLSVRELLNVLSH